MSTFPDPVITFDKSLTTEILYWFDKSIDPEGFVVDLEGNRIRALDGEIIKPAEIAGIIGVNGEEKMIRNTLPALIEAMDVLKERVKDGS